MKKVYLLAVIMFLTGLLQAQPWLKNLPQNKTRAELTFFDYQNAFYTYWKPYNVDKGVYYENGVKKKAIGWKQFKRWEYNMETRINPKTGVFPQKSAIEIYKEFTAANSQQNKGTTASWTLQGPTTSTGGYAGVGRINCIAFHPSDNNTYWVGAASGGLWVTTNNGTTWSCLTDNNGVLAVSDIVIPSNYVTSQTIYIATGDKDHWDNSSIGVLKSTNGGSTWNATGLSYTISSGKMVNRLLLNPTNNQILIAATSNGVYKTTDGGTTWNTQLSTTSFIDMEYKPGDFNTLYGSTTNGVISVTSNGGSSWTQAYYNSSARRIELAVSANQPSWVYAMAAGSTSGLYAVLKSNDNGLTYSMIFDGASKNLLGWASAGDDTDGQGWYDLSLAVSPTDANIILAGGVNTWRSTNGGTIWSIANHWWGDGVPAVHADKHNLIFRNNGDLFEVNDGGIYISTNNGTTWTDKTNGMAISQMYKLGVSQTVSNETITGLQDNGTKLRSGGSWSDVKGGDGMECLIDYTNVNIQYGTYVNGQISKTLNHWSTATDIEPSAAGNGAWVTPYIINPLNPQILYAGYADVWKTKDRGISWTQISTINTSNKIRSMAIAASDTSVLYITDHSNIWKTTNGGSSWTNITGTLPVSSGSITEIAVKNNDANTLWVSMSGYNTNKVFQSTNGGSTWTNISTGLPQIPAYSIVQNKQSTTSVQLYIGTELGVYFKNGSNNWVAFNTGLPNVKIGEIELYYASNPQLSKLRAATYGRGLWETPVYYSSTAMTYVSGTTTQNNTTKVSPGKTKQEIIGVEIVTSGNLSPLNVTSFTFNTNGSTNAISDISNAKLYSSTTSGFDSINQVGTTITLPNGTFTITGNFTLTEGVNYFWLTYDIPATATIGNFLDAQCTSFTIGTAKIPTITNPSGSRQIGITYCAANGDNCDEYISNVNIGTINNPTACATGGYADYTSLSANINPGSALPITISNGISYSGDQCGIWVDWNNNGNFTDDGTISVTGSPGGGPYSATILCPQGTTSGAKRMRIRIHYNNEVTSPCGNAYYGEVEDYTLTVVAACTPPTTQATNISSSAIANTSMTLNWTRGNGNNVLVVCRLGAAVTSDPINDSVYTANNAYGLGSQIGTGNYVVYKGTATSVNISGLIAGSTYYFAVYEYNNTGYCYKIPALTGNYSTTGTPPYCVAGSIYTTYEYISNVSLGSINQTSGNVTGGYQDFTSLSTTLQIGTSYSATITVGNPYTSDQILIWIDWNQDGDFTDADENVYASIGSFSTPHIISGFTPPSGALLGNTRMRIRLHDSGAGPNSTPCGNSSYGEVEDYSINLISNTCSPVNITNHPATMQTSCSPSANISFTVTATGDSPITYQWQYNNGGNWVNVSNGIPTGAIYTNANSNTMTVNGITNASSYEYRCYLSNCNGINFQTSNNALLVINPNPSNAGTISGTATVCQNQNNILYTVATINNATSYSWTLPAGATGSSTTNTISVNYGSNAVSGNITVKGSNACGDGVASSKSITVNALPGVAGSISGTTTVCKNQNNIIYSIASIANATSYSWTLPVGATGSSATNTISVNYGSNAVSGNITVKGSNTCGESNVSSLTITVKAIPEMAQNISGEDSVNQGQGNIVYTVPPIANANTYSWTLPANVSGNSSNNSINLYFSDSSLSGNLTVKGQNECGNGEPLSIYIKVFKQLNVNLFLEGIYQPLTMMMAKVQDENGDHFPGNISDTINVSLHNATSPNQLLHSFATINLLQNGWCSFRIPSEINQAYYMAIRHRNHIETWSSFPVSFANDTVTYDFTNAIDKAYGDNQKQVSPGKFAILVGDVNQDGVVDLSDLVNMDSDLTNGSLGYIVYDLNGDGIIDLSDLVKIDENLTNGVVVITP